MKHGTYTKFIRNMTYYLYIFLIFFIRKIIASLTGHNIRKNQHKVSKNSLSLGLVAYTDKGQ